MLAARDQENLVHVHQTAAASKPLNQGTKTLQPKTPGNKVPQTPFKIPLNDKIGITVFGGGKNGGLKARAGGNENLVTGGKKGVVGDKTAFVTPLATRKRAPLGFKTTNAKAKPFQTPGTSLIDNEAKKTEGKGVGLKPKVSHSETDKLAVLEDLKDNNGPEEEIEYMPPRVKELPDLPDDLPHDIDLSLLKNGGIHPGFLHHFVTRAGPDGLTFYERKEKEQQRVNEIADKISEATFTRDFESLPFPCIHRQECPGEECSASIANRKAAELKYQKTITALSERHHSKNPKLLVTKKVNRPDGGPSTLTSKTAATALSQPTEGLSSPLKAKLTTKLSPHTSKTTSVFSRPKKQPPQPTNPSIMRHTAASALSKTTIGHSKGRATSAAMRTSSSVLPPGRNVQNIKHIEGSKIAEGVTAKEAAAAAAAQTPNPALLAPAVYIERYGVPRIGSEMWIRCERAGCFDTNANNEEVLGGEQEAVAGSIQALDDLLREEAEKDFQLV